MGESGALDAMAKVCGLTLPELRELGGADVLKACSELSGLPERDPQTWMLAATAFMFRLERSAACAAERRAEAAERRMAELRDEVLAREEAIMETIRREKEMWDREGMEAALGLIRNAAKQAIELGAPPAKRKGFFS